MRVGVGGVEVMVGVGEIEGVGKYVGVGGVGGGGGERELCVVGRSLNTSAQPTTNMKHKAIMLKLSII